MNGSKALYTAILAGLIRHALTMIGGAWAATSSDDINLLAGSVVGLVGIAWSIYNKIAVNKEVSK